jgi:transposase
VASKRDEQARLIAEQQATIAELRAVVAEMRLMLEQMRVASAARDAELDALKRKAFGKSSEKMPSPKDALRKKDQTKVDPEVTKQKRRENQARKDELQTEIVPHRVPDEKRVCPACTSSDLINDAAKARVDYDYVPGYFRRRMHHLEVLVCRCCQTELVADAPKRPFEKSPYGPGLIAHVIVQKCACSVPIYRLEKQFRWLGIPVSRSTMTDLFHMAAEKLRPLYQRLLYRIAQSDVVSADETTLTIQERAKRGYMWTFRTSKLVAYKFSQSRSGTTPLGVLGGTTGTLVVDAYTGYNPVVDVDGRVRAGCLAHVRRKFFDALATAPEAQQALDLILDVYRVEHKANERGIVRTDAHARLRDTQSRAAMDALHAWMTTQQGSHLPKGPMGKAVSYALENWQHLQVFLSDVHVPVDSRVGSRRGECVRSCEPWLFLPFRASVPLERTVISVSGSRHIKPDRRISRIRLTARVSSNRVYGSVSGASLSLAGNGSCSHRTDPMSRIPPRYSTASTRIPFASAA